MSVSEGLGPEARALLDAAREGLSPDAAAVRRVHARVHAAVAGGTAGAAGTALGVKIAALAVVAAIAIGAVVVARWAAAPSGSVTMPVIELASPVERPQHVAVHEAALPAAVDDALITIEPTTGSTTASASGSKIALQHRRSASPTLAAAAPAASAAAAPPTSAAPARAASSGPVARATSSEAARRTGIELSREVELVDLAMAALRRGDAAAALRTMQEYAAEAAGGGQLTQDAAAIEIEALCQLHDPAAHDKLAAFDARFPRSAQRARLAGACQ